jgi:hypothetical protein
MCNLPRFPVGNFASGSSVMKYKSTEEIDYFSELNLNNDLTKENVVNLLRWKDKTYLTEEIKRDNKIVTNDKVDKVVAQLSQLNKFRRSEITPDAFKKITGQFFPNGVIWKIFIFHICKPLCYPIADQHVFRSYSRHKGCTLRIGWEKYQKYREYFKDNIQALYGESITINELYKRKRLDNALMVYGQFLKKYEK